MCKGVLGPGNGKYYSYYSWSNIVGPIVMNVMINVDWIYQKLITLIVIVNGIRIRDNRSKVFCFMKIHKLGFQV